MSTIQEKIKELREPIEDDREQTIAILETLPPDIQVPLVCNIGQIGYGGFEGSWLSFKGRSYDPDKTYDPVAILQALEAHGFEHMPATLCKWDQYRPSPEPGTIDNIPDNRPRGEKLSDHWPIMPLWVCPHQHTTPEAVAFYKAPNGMVFRVSIDMCSFRGNGFVSAQARRIEYMGDWRFDRQTARLHYPESWTFINHPDGEQHAAAVHVKSGAQVDTEQGISGQLYWEPFFDELQLNMSPADILTDLIS